MLDRQPRVVEQDAARRSHGLGIADVQFFYHYGRLLGARCSQQARLKRIGGAAVIGPERSWNIAKSTRKVANPRVMAIHGQALMNLAELAKRTRRHG